MALIARTDVTFPPRSVMRPGGCPADDDAYENWRDEFVADVNRRWADDHFLGELPSRDLLTAYHLDESLFLATGGSRLFWQESETYNHRKRHLAIEFKTNPKKMHRLAMLHLISSTTR